MQNNVAVTLSGNIVADLEVNYTKSKPAVPVTNFNIASTPRYFDSKKNDWVDAETIFTRCVLWNQHAENAAESYHKGDRVLVTGVMVAKPWTDTNDDGEEIKRVSYELHVSDIGASTLFSTLKIERVTADSDDDVEEAPAKKPARRAPARKR